jgi:hypothetical protein
MLAYRTPRGPVKYGSGDVLVYAGPVPKLSLFEVDLTAA